MDMKSPPTKVVTAARWLLALCMAGCPAANDDMPAPDGGADSGGTGTETATGTGTGTETAAETDASSTSSGGEASVPWNDLACDMEVCEGSEICFKPVPYCSGPCVNNYRELVTPPRRCEPFPAHCDPLDPGNCIGEALCIGGKGDQFNDGYLICYGPGDCYCEG